MDLCLIQCDPRLGRENIRILEDILQNVPADLYILPELFAVGFEKAATDWRNVAEPFLSGPTYQEISSVQRVRPTSSVIYGFPENENAHYFNAAAVIGEKGSVACYHQKNAALRGGGKIFPVEQGDFMAAYVGPMQYCYRCKVGLMICSDHYSAENFFKHYSDAKNDAIVLIADSLEKPWLTQFPHLCSKYKLPAIICNAAGNVGEGKGESCLIDSGGNIISRLPDFPKRMIIKLEWF